MPQNPHQVASAGSTFCQKDSQTPGNAKYRARSPKLLPWWPINPQEYLLEARFGSNVSMQTDPRVPQDPEVDFHDARGSVAVRSCSTASDPSQTPNRTFMNPRPCIMYETVFDDRLNELQPRRHRRLSTPARIAQRDLRRRGGTCQKHRAAKKTVRSSDQQQTLTDTQPVQVHTPTCSSNFGHE